MKIKLGDYFIETDERQYKVRKYQGQDKDGNDTYKSIAYCTTLAGALKFIPQQVIRENNEINKIVNSLFEIEKDIEAFKEKYREIKGEKEI